MPTSTLWRRDAVAVSPAMRGTSPSRPTESIERISPEPSLPPSFSAAARTVRTPSYDQPSLFGLGLSRYATGHDGHPERRSEHIYTDYNGVAHATNTNANTDVHPSYRSPHSDRPNRHPKHSSNAPSTKAKGHTRSGSTIDDLADAAIATSPTFANGSPNQPSFIFSGSPSQSTPTRPSTSHITRYGYYDSNSEHPTKRVKSEIIQQYEFTHHYPRPTTSYHQPANRIPDEDVALLLNLKQEVNFKGQQSPALSVPELHKSPPTHTLQYSPIPDTPLDYPVSHQPHQLPFPHHSNYPQRNGSPPDTANENKELAVDSTFQHAHPIQMDSAVPSHPTTQQPAVTPQPSVDLLSAPSELPIEEEVVAIEDKKPRRIKPQTQEVCAGCDKLQSPADEDDTTISWICCNPCNRWFHSACAGFKNKSEARSVDKFVCKACEPEHGETTFVRKSSRARTAIDYAELNQGLVKSSIETSMHHYIEPIKAGKYPIQPDDFMRIRPELLTVEFLQSFDNMKRPFVVPAAWNPRFGAQRPAKVPSQGDKSVPFDRINSNGDSAGPDPEELELDHAEQVIDCDQDLLDMVMPRDLTVRKVAELYGKNYLVPVIDVKSQETKGSFTLEQWADYYEDSGDKPVRNVISLEVSESPLGRLIRRPKVVRDLDLEELVWDPESRSNQKKRPVQFYCLMSVADCYTDFHIDFGGSSVYYHILKGTKTFFFIPPEDRYLKKYEDWCNSSTQNDTWLPDLCNGNVTRVDLHEGDTAFIPAGWIHSVWTPEDSLVIGGNFLTPIDYDLQLKVAQVEKATKVAAKFRYPFFQKVMWYALIKYLEDDPVPDEVLDDFQEDAEYVFLRANPVWLEIGELENTEPPGSAFYNAKYYPKAEIKGLPALRDYLYRTARIYADLPVDNINKKQIDAVKASVPKGPGDPLVLIKTFAIWCAWKTGSVTIPSWVYSDASGFPEAEKKVKKQESYRLPGERVSSRKAAQVTPRESTGPAVITPYKPGFTAAGVNSDPAKKGRPPSAKPTTARSACDSCRKRRVKCKHRDGEGSTGGSEQPMSRSTTPDNLAPAATDSVTQNMTPLRPSPFPGFVPDVDTTYMTSGLAQAALASLDGQDPTMTTPNGTAQSSGKKSRSKACEECRKSKRRCVHDEYGRVDPAKAAEPSKPRGSSNAKRPSRPSDEGLHMKRPRFDDVYNGNTDAMLDPALFATDVFHESTNEPDQDSGNGELDPSLFETHSPVLPGSEVYPNDATLVPANIDPELVADRPLANGHVAGSHVKAEIDEDVVMIGTEAENPNPSPARDPNEHAIIDSPETRPYMNGVKRESISGSPTSQRHSSRQPKQIDRFVPDDARSLSKILPQQARSASMASSNRPSPASIRNGEGRVDGGGRRSSSNTSGTIHQMNGAGQMNGMGMAMKNEGMEGRQRSVSTAESSVLDEDERLARELQAQEHGLRRRRSSMVKQ